MKRLMVLLCAAIAAAGIAKSTIVRGLGNEEIVDCNGGDGWTARPTGSRPSGNVYTVYVEDMNAKKIKFNPTRKGSEVSSVGLFEFRGKFVEHVAVEVDRDHVAASAFSKIHDLLKKKEPVALTIICHEKDASRARLVGAEFSRAGKTFEEAEDGKVREVVKKP